MTETFEPALVPELLVSDIDRSLAFWCDLCGFEIRHSRPKERFAYISLGSAHLMLEQIGIGRNWITGPLETPFGRGINFQINVPSITPLVSALADAGIDLLMQPETKWYRIGDDEAGVEQFLVTDPDGYLIRFQTSRGRRPVPRSTI
ncbi:MAG: VOC family protein [Cryobacterium sp.]|uniref:bleomycin resistance protein n=1 Tax=Cryobacterium sp. TaxID=1926290 RepID=UPI002288B956|nr:VOC family protein [Cryobacterium sp.]MCY7404919.1 VOC family protein [Cryobacterium sp.]